MIAPSDLARLSTIVPGDPLCSSSMTLLDPARPPLIAPTGAILADCNEDANFVVYLQTLVLDMVIAAAGGGPSVYRRRAVFLASSITYPNRDFLALDVHKTW